MNFNKTYILCLLLTIQFVSAKGVFEKDIKPILEKYCYKCHDEDVQKGDIRLDLALTEEDVVKERKLWLRALHQLEEEEMPPKKPFLSEAENKTIIEWLDKTLHHYDWSKVKNPGYVSLSRLTNEEYKNSVRDLFGVDFHKGSNWVSDPEGDSGFTNDRDNLSISISSMNKYLLEAEEYVDGLLSYQEKPWTKEINMGKSLKFETNPEQANITFPFTGVYKLTVKASAQGQPITGMRVMLNGRKIFGKTIRGNEPKEYSIPVFAQKGFAILMVYVSTGDAALYSDDRVKFPISKSLKNKIKQASKNPPQLKIPDKYKNNKKIVDAYRQVNKVAARCYSSKKAAEIYMKMEKMPDDLEPIRGLLKGSVPTNISNGRLSVLLGISTKQMFAKWKEETGEDFGVDFSQYRKIREAFKKKYNEQYGYKKDILGKLKVESLRFEGPFLPAGSKDPKPLLNKVTNRESVIKALKFYTGRAFRNKVSQTDVQPFLKVYDETMKETGSHKASFRDSLISILVSPRFLLHRNEMDIKSSKIDQFQIASRLSYFLWQSMPDSQLFGLASGSKLSDEKLIHNEINRMVADEKFSAFCEAFSKEWLNLESIQGVSPLLEKAMRLESQLLLKRVFQENRNLFELIEADYTYLNELLARHYEIEGVKGDHMRLVSLNTGRRGGLLTMGSMLSATSLPSRTSPVNRGAWIVETILGEELPPPPDGVPELPANAGKGPKTLRQELEKHRQDPKCAGCHDRIDPYGFILENFDKIGRWRDKEGTKKIDSKMTMKSGDVCKDITVFKSLVVKQQHEAIRRNLVERTLSFALGRKLKYYDEPAIMKIINQLKKNNDKAQTLLEGIVDSYPFLNQQLQEDE